MVIGHSNFFGISLSPHSKGGERRKTLIQAGHMPPKKWEVKKKKHWKGDVIKPHFCLSLTQKGNICPRIYHILVESQHQLRGEMSKTLKKIYAASSNAKSYSRLCKCEGGFSHCKNLFGKANHVLLLAAEEIYGSFLQRSGLFLHLRCRTCKRHL